jgi:hypothetical protein
LKRLAFLAAAIAMIAAPGLAAAAPQMEGRGGTGLPFTPKGQRGAYNGPGGPTVQGIGDTSPYKTARDHWEALKKGARGGLILKAADLPDWGGVWVVDDTPVDFDPSLPRDADIYGPLAPDNQKFYDQTMRNAEKNIDWDPLSNCLPSGFPRFVAAPRLKDFAVTPSVVYMMNEIQAEIRRVYTDGRGHRPDDEAYPLWEGDAIGFWDGKGENARLIVWTNNLKTNILMRNQPRFSDKAEVVEVYQKVDKDHIKLDLTLYDPVDLTRPWTVHRHYVHDGLPNGRIDMWVCNENNNVVNEGGGTNFVLSGEKGYKDPNVFTDPTKNAPK